MIKHQLQVGRRGPNNIGRGIGCKMVKNWMISLPEFTNDLGPTGRDLLSRILLTATIALAPCQELMNIPSGALDAGYIYHSKN
jgi:hypothetical protein